MKNSLLFILLLLLVSCKESTTFPPTGMEERAYWVETMTKIVDPVLSNISQGTLKRNIPFESLSDSPQRLQSSYLESFGRTLCGIAPWLELGPDDSEEGRLRAKYLEMTLKGIAHAVTPDSPDHLIFDGSQGAQALVDAAFFAHGLLRAPTQLWGNLDDETKAKVIVELKKSRAIKPFENNWLLFASLVEAALLEFTGEYDAERICYGVDRFCKEWYKGDGWYGDGADFHLDYYNSFVIHPMLTDILRVLKRHNLEGAAYLENQLKRLERFAVQQERLISPEGTYPVVGRSIVYRFGAFQALSQAALQELLPGELPYPQVRCALSAVIKRVMESPGNFDENGWLKVGFTGSQINMSESYINTGSLYLCTAVFLPLGLPSDHDFWSGDYTEWTNLKAWKGTDVGSDKALRR